MTAMPLLLEPLADQSLNIAAIALRTANATAVIDTQSFPEEKGFEALAEIIPCVIAGNDADRLPPASRERLQNAGWQIIDPDAILTTNDAERVVLPPKCRWLAGRWYLAQAGKSPGNQAASRALELKLLELVANDADTHEIEAVFRQDPVLSYHLLRLVNSIGIGTNRHISSFSQAILILGRQQLKRWLNLMLFSANRNDYRSAMLLAHVAIRARTMELTAKACGLDHHGQEQAFMAGMFSLLGVLFGLPLNEVLTPLNLSAPLAAALLKKEGEIGGILCALESAELFDSPALLEHLARLGVSSDDYNAITLEAHQWMLGVIHRRSDDGDV